MDQHRTGKTMNAQDTATIVLNLVEQLSQDLRPHTMGAVSVTLDSSLERDLGFDSLGRAELLGRLEKTFHLHLPDDLLTSAETPRDLFQAVQQQNTATSAAPAANHLAAALDATSGAPIQAQTLVDVLDWHVQVHPQRPHISLYDDTGQIDNISYMDLYEGAKAIAAGLRAHNVQPRQTVALMLPTSRQFFESFYGILLTGGIPAPIYPPARPSQVEAHMRRQADILDNARAVMLITSPQVQRLAYLLKPRVDTLRHVVTAQELSRDKGDDARVLLKKEDIAFLQYTSGSTGHPKGVILSHANLLANLRAMLEANQVSSQDIFVSWLPLYHDMGLIGAWMGSLYQAFHLVLMSPLSFLARPERWLWAIHHHRGTISGSPNFGYELCAQRINDAELEGLDLRCWRLAFNGAEPVSPNTIERFTQRFAPYGFHSEAMTPVYGLAEVALGLTFPPPGQGPRIDRVQREPFMQKGRAMPSGPQDTEALAFVSCGRPLPGYQLQIVDPAGVEAPERQEGRLEFRGPSTTSGYFRNAEETRRLFHGPWVDSGDLAYIAEGHVYITGRVKDIIIRAGHNIYPQEVEEAIGSIPGIRKGCVAVFGSPDPASGTERLVVMAETREATEAHPALRQQIDAQCVSLLGEPADDVVLAPPQTVLKTSSGKLRRSATRELYEHGTWSQARPAVWRQIARLGLAGVLPQLRRMWHAGVDLSYAAYVWAVFGALATCTWFLIISIPQRAVCQWVAQLTCRLVLRLGHFPVRVQGLEHLPQDQSFVLVVNHSSYLDALVLLAVLPPGLRYVAKREFAIQFLSGRLFRRLGVAFVERVQTQQSLADMVELSQAVEQGDALVMFPEGGFSREPGLRPFHLGAFTIAAQTGKPVIPTAIQGTRSILPSGQWLPRRGAIRVTVGAPLMPQGDNWEAAIQLRDDARADILRHCGEPVFDMPLKMPTSTPENDA